MAEQPALNRIYVLGYSANDRDYPIVSLTADPRVAGYQVPKDLSACPDKRYPNHVFTGAQPIAGDQRVRHVWEILPSPWVPFTRYDDDLGPVQGRRRSVKNEGQVASLTADKRTTYEAREGSAIVYTELEETWSIATDDDGNSLFPIRNRDFYDPSRGPVQERRQLFVPTGEEEGSLENVNGVITQTSYEPYNEFLSVKIVQTYKVDGPRLIGKATDNDGQLVTVTTQRKGALDYIPPNPTATRTVEVSREDAESLVERIVDTPEVFKANTFSVERPDPIPQKFRVAVPIQSSQEIVEGTAVTPTLEEGEISKSEEQRNKFIKRVSSTSRDQAVLPQTLTGKTTNNERQEVTVTETLQLGNTTETPTATTTIESEALGDGNYVITKTEVDEVFGAEVFRKTKDDLTPQKFRGAQEESTVEQNIEGIASGNISLASGEFSKSEQQINKFVKRVSTTSRAIETATTLLESVLTPEGLLGTRTLTLALGAQSFVPSATLVDANVEALGDGRTIKTETTISDIFGARAVSVERPDSTPAKFRALVPSKTDQLNVVGSVSPSITLADGEVAKSETQQTQFVKRIASTTRDQTVLPKTLVQKATSEDRQVATVTETLQANDTVETPTATKTIESEAIGDGNYVVRKTEVPEVFSAKTFSKERPDPVPQKFRVVVPSLTEQETLEGEAQEPSLITGEISKSEQQVNKFVKRISKTTRDETTLPQSLTQKTTTNEGLLATVSETLQSGDTSVVPTATKTVQSEALGDGTYVVTVTDLPKVFAGETYSVERPDPLPQKFRVAARTLTNQQTIAGTADPNVDLVAGQLSKSEQQVTEFVKRTSITSRDQTQLPVTLTQRAVDNDRQSVTVTETLQDSEAIEPNSATVTIQSEALGDGNFLITKLEIPEVFGADVFRKTREDLTPQKFKAAQEDSTVEKNVEGTASSAITLATGEFAKSEQQINKFIKRVSTTSRSTTVTPDPLVEAVLTNEGQIGTRTLTLASGPQTITPSATMVDANVEALGDGRTVKTETVVPNVFSGKTVQKSRIDLTPEKFKAEQEDTTTEESVAGTVNPSISLETGEFRKSEQQVTEFVKRVSSTTRDITATRDLEEVVITPQGQIATRTLILSAEAQSIQPDALLVDGSIEALGDGRTVKSETRVGEVFEGKTLSLEKPDVTPQKWRAAIPSSSVETTEAGTVTDPITLIGDEISKSEQQVTEFVKRVRKTTRDAASAGTLNKARVYTSELGGGIATITETYGDSGDITVGLNTVSASTEELGDGKFVGQAVELPTIPTLVGQDYDELLDVVFPYTQTVVPTLSSVPEDPEIGVDLVPRNNLQTTKRTRDKAASRAALLDFNWTFGSTVNVSLPDILLGVKCINTVSTGGGQAGSGFDELELSAGTNLTIVRGGWYNVIGNIVYNIKEGYSGPVDANRHVFFLDRDSATLENVVAKLNTLSIYSGINAVKRWPKTKPVKRILIVSGGRIEINATALINGEEIDGEIQTNQISLSDDNGGSIAVTETPIPATLHDELVITVETSTIADLTPDSEDDIVPLFTPIVPTISIVGESEPWPTNSSTPLKLPATTPPSFEAGNYLLSIDTEPYRFGLVRVSAIVALVNEDYL